MSENYELEFALRYAKNIMFNKGYEDAKNKKDFWFPHGSSELLPELYHSYSEGYNSFCFS